MIFQGDTTAATYRSDTHEVVTFLDDMIVEVVTFPNDKIERGIFRGGMSGVEIFLGGMSGVEIFQGDRNVVLDDMSEGVI